MNTYQKCSWTLVALHVLITIIWGLMLNNTVHGYLYMRLTYQNFTDLIFGYIYSVFIFTVVFCAILLLIEFFERKSGVVFKRNTISPLTIFILFQVLIGLLG